MVEEERRQGPLLMVFFDGGAQSARMMPLDNNTNNDNNNDVFFHIKKDTIFNEVFTHDTTIVPKREWIIKHRVQSVMEPCYFILFFAK